MALTTIDLIYPQGELTDKMFPLGYLQQNVSQWLTEKSGQSDAAVRYWVYYRAYRTVANMLASEPASQNSFGEVSRTYSGSQIKHFADLADVNLAAYNELAEEENPTALIPAKVRVF